MYLYVIIKAMMSNEFIRIQRYTTSKQAWDILETTHEGISTVKRSRVLKLNRDFVLCIMQ